MCATVLCSAMLRFLTFDLHKVGCYEQGNECTAALAVHGHTKGHALGT